MVHNFKIPPNLYIGNNALRESSSVIAVSGKKAFIVSGKNVTASGAVGKLTDLLYELKISYELFNDIVGEPDDITIKKGRDFYLQSGCDFIIGIGGGSPLDSAKAIALMSVCEGEIIDFAGKEIRGDLPQLIMIPTTAGTGSEVTKFTVITDSVSKTKLLLKGDDLLPDMAIVDPQFTVTAPPSVTAATGMDALTHAIEAYISVKATPMIKPYALDAIKRIFEFLPIAYDQGDNLTAREELAIAACQAGICINNSSVTVVHGMSRPIGAIFHVPHGISNAMLLAGCMKRIQTECAGVLAEIAKAAGFSEINDDDKAAAGKLIDQLVSLSERLNIPKLKDYGIDQEVFYNSISGMAAAAVSSGSPSNLPVTMSQEEIENLYQPVIGR